MKLQKLNKLSPSEALFGFVGWLTTRPETLKLGAKHTVPPAIDTITKFCKCNKLEDPRDGWEKNLIHPSESLHTPE